MLGFFILGSLLWDIFAGIHPMFTGVDILKPPAILFQSSWILSLKSYFPAVGFNRNTSGQLLLVHPQPSKDIILSCPKNGCYTKNQMLGKLLVAPWLPIWWYLRESGRPSSLAPSDYWKVMGKWWQTIRFCFPSPSQGVQNKLFWVALSGEPICTIPKLT